MKTLSALVLLAAFCADAKPLALSAGPALILTAIWALITAQPARRRRSVIPGE